MLVDHVIESQNAGLLESVLMPFDIYNDAAQHALVVLKQRFLYDEIEAEVIKPKKLKYHNKEF